MKNLLIALITVFTFQSQAEDILKSYVGKTESQAPCRVDILEQSSRKLTIRFTVNPGTDQEQSTTRHLRSAFSKKNYSAQVTLPAQGGFLTLITKVQLQNNEQSIQAQLQAINSTSDVFIFDTVTGKDAVTCNGDLQ